MTKETTTGLELLDFWAEWCGPCKIMEPILNEIEREYKHKLSIRRIDVDSPENQGLMLQYNILSVPTYILIKDDDVVDHFVGIQSKDILIKKIDAQT